MADMNKRTGMKVPGRHRGCQSDASFHDGVDEEILARHLVSAWINQLTLWDAVTKWICSGSKTDAGDASLNDEPFAARGDGRNIRRVHQGQPTLKTKHQSSMKAKTEDMLS